MLLVTKFLHITLYNIYTLIKYELVLIKADLTKESIKHTKYMIWRRVVVFLGGVKKLKKFPILKYFYLVVKTFLLNYINLLMKRGQF